jgi:hypothetical protein
MATSPESVPKYNKKLVDDLEHFIDAYLLDYSGGSGSISILLNKQVGDGLKTNDKAELANRYMKVGWSDAHYSYAPEPRRSYLHGWCNHYWILKH